MVLAAVTTYPELWAAGVDIVGIANFVTFLENTGPWRRRLRESEYGSLENDRDFLEEISPIHKVDRITAPMLVIHGANDPRVPVGEAEQIVAALSARGARRVPALRGRGPPVRQTLHQPRHLSRCRPLPGPPRARGITENDAEDTEVHGEQRERELKRGGRGGYGREAG